METFVMFVSLMTSPASCAVQELTAAGVQYAEDRPVIRGFSAPQLIGPPLNGWPGIIYVGPPLFVAPPPPPPPPPPM